MSRSTHTSQLLRQSVIQQGSSPGSLHSSPAAAVTSTRTEIWRSETVAQVFVDFWLSHGEGEVGPVFSASGSPQRVSCIVFHLLLYCFGNKRNITHVTVHIMWEKI